MTHNTASVQVMIPVYRPDQTLRLLLERLLRQTRKPDRILLINTEESLFDASLVEGLEKVEVRHISRKEFDHGATRHMGAEMLDGDYLLFMTQDALPADSHLVENLAACLEKENTGAAYARQLPRPDCQVIERITRSFNYPEKGAVHTAEDVPALGIKAYFCSNVCAMYRRDLYEALGGFCRRAIFNEDMLFAAALIGNGYAVEYCAQARVYHSHNYSLKQQFSRNFDLAVSQAEHPEVFEAVPSEGEGLRLVRYTSGKLLRSGKGLWIPYFFLQCAAKYAGYFLGKRWRRLPERVILKMTMNPGYWEKEFREQN